jgi:hypothetical protein
MRLLSSGWDDADFSATMDRFSDWGAIGDEMTTLAAADKRLLAVQETDSVQIFDFIVTSSPEWREVMFYMIALPMLVIETATKLSWQSGGLNILSHGVDTPLWDDDMVTGANSIHFLNEFELHVSETFWQSPDGPFDDPANLKYSVVDHDEVLDGSLDGYFNMIVMPLHRMQDFSYEMVNKLVDSLAPGGLLICRNMAPRNFSYYQPMFLHAYPEHDYSRLLADHPDLTSRHMSWGNGLVVAYKNAE